MYKILYVVSTLQRSGPTNQLFNVIKYLDKDKFEPYLITFSPEPDDSRWHDFADLGVNLQTLNLSRLQGLFFAKSKLKKLVKQIQPTLIHTQGIRSDSLIANMNLHCSHVATIHNFAPDDYLTKFGSLKGKLMVYQHFKMMRKSSHLIACSKTIYQKLSSVGINSFPIQNGVEVLHGNPDNVSFFDSLTRPIFISVGSLIPRKNMGFLINSFNKSDAKGSLVILGDGQEMSYLKSIAGESVHLVGNVNNVPDYLAAADYFVSTSLSEGLPNTVLESLSAGVPAMLSNIASHEEIHDESTQATKLFSLDDEGECLCGLFTKPEMYFDITSKPEAMRIANKVFSARIMSLNYQDYYRDVLINE